MTDTNEIENRGELLLQQLTQALECLRSSEGVKGAEAYASYMHGQIYGLATAMKIMFPGPGNWGEKAALAVRPFITEHRCDCDD